MNKGVDPKVAVALLPTRKTIQVTAVMEAGRYLVLALCDDGTIWKMGGLYEGAIVWTAVPTPPAIIE